VKIVRSNLSEVPLELDGFLPQEVFGSAKVLRKYVADMALFGTLGWGGGWKDLKPER